MKLSRETIRRMVGQQSGHGSVSISGSGGGGGVTSLAGLTDVQIGTLADGQALMYDDNAKKWINGPVITDMATKTWVTAQNNAVKEWVNNNYISIAYFGRLFQAYSGSTAVNPNDTDSVIDGIKAMFGFWTDQYISSLGQNDAGGSGGGGGEGTVTRVAFSAPTGFSVSGSPVTSSGTIALTFADGYSLPTTAQQTTWSNKQDAISDLATIRSNASHGQTAYGWGNHADAGYLTSEQYVGTVTEILTGTGLSGGPITGSGTISINATYLGYIAHGQIAYEWGNHADYNYATQSWVQQQGYLTSHQSVDGTFWGQSWSNHGSVSGSLTGVGNITSNTHGSINGFAAIELSPDTGSDIGGAIYFHYNGEAAYSSAFITENAQGILSVQGHGTTGLVVGDANNDYIQIGAVRLVYDSTNNALKLIGSDDSAAGLYATGFVSALGMSSGVSQIDSMTFGRVNIGSVGSLSYTSHDFHIDGSGDVYLNSNSGDVILPDCSLSVKEGSATLFRIDVEDYNVLYGGDAIEMAIKIYYRDRYYTLDVAAAINAGILI